MNVMGNTITGAASGETGFSGAEGFTISGKRTEDDHELLFQDSFCSAEIGEANLFFYILLEENVSRGMILTGERAESHCFSSVSDLIGFYSAPFCAFLPELQANQANRRRPGTRGANFTPQHHFFKTTKAASLCWKQKRQTRWGKLTQQQKRAIVSVIGKDQVGIIAKVTTLLAERNINILDISQTILQEFFTMMMLVDITNLEDLESLQQQLAELGKSLGLTINIQREEIFQAMHRV